MISYNSDETLCWDCNEPYLVKSHKCPSCGAINANYDQDKAFEQMLQKDVDLPPLNG